MARKDDRGSGGGDGLCMIDPVVLGGVINDLSTMESAITIETKGLQAEFEKVGVSARPIADLLNVSRWLHDQLPMLRRRHRAAVLLSSQGLPFTPGTKMLSMPENPDVATKQAAGLAAQRVRDGLDGKPPGRDGIVAAVRTLQGIKNAKGQLSPDDLLFLESFYGDLGEDVYKVPVYLKNDGNWVAPTRTTYAPGETIPTALDAKTRTELAAVVVVGLLTLSEERRGGGWNHLPRFVQESVSDPFKVNILPDRSTVQRGGRDADEFATFLTHADAADRGGVVFSKRLAITAAESVDDYKQISQIPPAMPYTDDVTARIFLQLASRNEQSMRDLITGKGMEVPASIPTDIYDGYTVPKDFLLAVTTNAWSDDGKAASGVIDWIADTKRSTDPTRHQLADEAMTGLVTTLTDPAVFKEELDIGKQGSVLGMPMTLGAYPDLGAVNPEITRSLARDAAAFLSELAADENDELSSARLFTLIATDPVSADALAGAVYQHNVGGVHDALTHDDHLIRNAEPAGRLHGLLDAAVHNVAIERTDDLIQAKADADAARGKILGIVSEFTTKGFGVKIPSAPGMDPVDIADKLLNRLNTMETGPVQPHQLKTDGVDPTSTSGARLLVRYNFTKALVESGQLKVEDLPGDIRSSDVPPRLMSPAEFSSRTYAARQDNYETAIKKVPGVDEKLDGYLAEFEAHASSTSRDRRARDRDQLMEGLLEGGGG